jgi:hypothetical protein
VHKKSEYRPTGAITLTTTLEQDAMIAASMQAADGAPCPLQTKDRQPCLTITVPRVLETRCKQQDLSLKQLMQARRQGSTFQKDVLKAFLADNPSATRETIPKGPVAPGSLSSLEAPTGSHIRPRNTDN